MKPVLIILAFASLVTALAGCGNNNQPDYMVVNQYHYNEFVPANSELDKEWLITDSTTTQNVYQALLALPERSPQACPISAGHYNYHLAFYVNNSKTPLKEADFIDNRICNHVTILPGQDVRWPGPNSSFFRLLLQAIGEPFTPVGKP